MSPDFAIGQNAAGVKCRSFSIAKSGMNRLRGSRGRGRTLARRFPPQNLTLHLLQMIFATSLADFNAIGSPPPGAVQWPQK